MPYGPPKHRPGWSIASYSKAKSSYAIIRPNQDHLFFKYRTASKQHPFPGRSYFKAEALHTTPVLVDGRLAVFCRVGGIREEHALVPLGFLVFADATGLQVKVVSIAIAEKTVVARVCDAPWASMRHPRWPLVAPWPGLSLLCRRANMSAARPTRLGALRYLRFDSCAPILNECV